METTGKAQVSLEDVKNEWLKRESHFVFEAHLPSLIPLSFVDKIIIPKVRVDHCYTSSFYPVINKLMESFFQNIWDSHLTAADKQQFKLAFPDSDVTVICDPVTGDVDGQLTLTIDRKKLMTTAMLHCALPSTTAFVHRPLGMSVALERGKGAILPLPFRFRVAGDGNIYFRTKGSEFYVVLTEKQTKEGGSGERLTFFFGGPRSHILYITKSPPSAHRMTLDKKNWVARDTDFDRGFGDGDWVNYHIQMDSK